MKLKSWVWVYIVAIEEGFERIRRIRRRVSVISSFKLSLVKRIWKFRSSLPTWIQLEFYREKWFFVAQPTRILQRICYCSSIFHLLLLPRFPKLFLHQLDFYRELVLWVLFGCSHRCKISVWIRFSELELGFKISDWMVIDLENFKCDLLNLISICNRGDSGDVFLGENIYSDRHAYCTCWDNCAVTAHPS